MKHTILLSAVVGLASLTMPGGKAMASDVATTDKKVHNPYEMAQRFAGSKLSNMLSTPIGLSRETSSGIPTRPARARAGMSWIPPQERKKTSSTTTEWPHS